MIDDGALALLWCALGGGAMPAPMGHMPAPRCPDHFKGRVSQFIDRFAERTFLPAATVAHAQRLVIDAMAPGRLLVVRNFGNYQTAAIANQSSDRKRTFVVGDNEPVVWFWRRLFAGTPVDLAEAIRRQELPISMSPQRGEEERHWATWGTGDASRLRERWRGAHGGRWKLCHVFGAAPAHLDDSESGLLARFVRNFHPINHFWFASEYPWSHGRFIMSPEPRLGESAAVCMAFWQAYSARYPKEADWFIEAARLSEVERKAACAASDPDVEFRWEVRPLTKGTPAAAPEDTGRTESVCVVRETDTGRFHLAQFGQSIGGPNRDKPFRFEVFSADGELLAQSGKVTAKELGIAERGRGDYDADRYHQTDFLIWEEGERLVPHRAPAKRVPKWIFY
jgi:hypothetical protein